MKKRLLGLALALVMIISLLPLTAIAADTPMPKFQMKDPNGNLESYFNDSNTVYVVYEDVLDTDGTTVLGNKPVIATGTPTDNYVKYEFNTAAATATITMKNVNYKRVSAAGNFNVNFAFSPVVVIAFFVVFITFYCIFIYHFVKYIN